MKVLGLIDNSALIVKDEVTKNLVNKFDLETADFYLDFGTTAENVVAAYRTEGLEVITEPREIWEALRDMGYRTEDYIDDRQKMPLPTPGEAALMMPGKYALWREADGSLNFEEVAE